MVPQLIERLRLQNTLTWFRALIVCREHSQCPVCDSSSGGLMPSSGLWGPLHTKAQTHTHNFFKNISKY